MALKIIHDNFSASKPVRRGPMVVLSFQDEDTGQEDAFIFSPDAFKVYSEEIRKSETGLVQATPAEAAAMRRKQ